MILSIRLNPSLSASEEYDIDEGFVVTLEVTGTTETVSTNTWYLSVPQGFMIGNLEIKWACLEQSKSDNSLTLAYECELDSERFYSEIDVLSAVSVSFVCPMV